MNELQKPTPEQLKALEKFAAIHGRNWKAPLREAWMTGDYDGFKESNYLQQLRNTLGPSWLAKFRLAKTHDQSQIERLTGGR